MKKFDAKAAVKKDYKEAIETKNIGFLEREIEAIKKEMVEKLKEIKAIKDMVKIDTEIIEAIKAEIKAIKDDGTKP